MFSDEVIMHLDVLCPSMKNWILRQMNTTHVVAYYHDYVLVFFPMLDNTIVTCFLLL